MIAIPEYVHRQDELSPAQARYIRLVNAGFDPHSDYRLLKQEAEDHLYGELAAVLAASGAYIAISARDAALEVGKEQGRYIGLLRGVLDDAEKLKQNTKAAYQELKQSARDVRVKYKRSRRLYRAAKSGDVSRIAGALSPFVSTQRKSVKDFLLLVKETANVEKRIKPYRKLFESIREGKPLEIAEQIKASWDQALKDYTLLEKIGEYVPTVKQALERLVSGDARILLAIFRESERFGGKRIRETVRTNLQTRAVNIATIEALHRKGEKTAIWESTLDERTSEMCRFLHGRKMNVEDTRAMQHAFLASGGKAFAFHRYIFSVAQLKELTEEQLAGLWPPLHPWCRSRLKAVPVGA